MTGMPACAMAWARATLPDMGAVLTTGYASIDNVHEALARGLEAADIVGVVGALSAFYHDAAACLLRDGEIVQTYRKRELPNYAVFDERRYFDVDPDREDCVFEVKGTRVGLVICEDLWFAEPAIAAQPSQTIRIRAVTAATNSSMTQASWAAPASTRSAS